MIRSSGTEKPAVSEGYEIASSRQFVYKSDFRKFGRDAPFFRHIKEKRVSREVFMSNLEKIIEEQFHDRLDECASDLGLHIRPRPSYDLYDELTTEETEQDLDLRTDIGLTEDEIARYSQYAQRFTTDARRQYPPGEVPVIMLGVWYRGLLVHASELGAQGALS